MRYVVFLLLLSGFFTVASAQNRQKALENFSDLKKQGENYEKIILSPDKEDIEVAKQQNLNVFRILPRETYDKGFFATRGSGAYYSFYFRIPDYGHGSDLQLEQNNFSIGFAGADYGLITDLGNVSLSNSDELRKGVSYLTAYKTPTEETKAREEKQRFGRESLEIDGLKYQRRLSAVVGHTYVVRSINYENYDVLAAFNVHRKDADGSLIIFWKLIEQFETPSLRAKKVQPSDEQIMLKTKSWTRAEMFPNVQTEVNNGVVTLRGKLPKDKLAYAVQLANDAGANKVINLLTVE